MNKHMYIVIKLEGTTNTIIKIYQEKVAQGFWKLRKYFAEI